MNKEIELKQCREAFEAMACWHDLTPHPLSAENYKDNDVQLMWKGWRDAWDCKNTIEAQLQAENARLLGALGNIRHMARFVSEDCNIREDSEIFISHMRMIHDEAKAALQHNEEV